MPGITTTQIQGPPWAPWAQTLINTRNGTDKPPKLAPQVGTGFGTPQVGTGFGTPLGWDAINPLYLGRAWLGRYNTPLRLGRALTPLGWDVITPPISGTTFIPTTWDDLQYHTLGWDDLS